MAHPDVNDFDSSCGVESEPLGFGPGYFGSDQQASVFTGILQAEPIVYGKGFFRCVYEYAFRI